MLSATLIPAKLSAFEASKRAQHSYFMATRHLPTVSVCAFALLRWKTIASECVVGPFGRDCFSFSFTASGQN